MELMYRFKRKVLLIMIHIVENIVGTFPKNFSQVATSPMSFPKWQLPNMQFPKRQVSVLAAELGPPSLFYPRCSDP